MTYSTNIEKPFEQNEMLVVIRPRCRVQTWTLHSGTVYNASFDYGRVNNVFENETELTQSASLSAIGSDEWFYDKDSNLLYVDIGEDPDNQFISVAFDIYLSTRSYNWYADPVDDTSDTAAYRSDIIEQPSLTERITDTVFGFTANEISSITINNADGFYNRILYDSSFNFAETIIYHVSGNISVDNIEEITKAVASNFSNDDLSITIELNSIDSLLDNEYAGKQFATTDVFANLDPNRENAPIPKVYGIALVENVINISYDEAIGTNKNRSWVVSQDQTDKATITKTMLSYSSGTITFSDVSGFQVEDQLRLSFAADIDQTVVINTINYNTNTITTNGGVKTFTAGDTATRPWIQAIYLASKNESKVVITRLEYIVDFSLADFSGDTKGFTLVNNFEANHGTITTLDPSIHSFNCIVYGETTLPTDSVLSTIGAVAQKGGTLVNPIAIMFKLLKEIRQLPDNFIDASSFNSLTNSNSQSVGIRIPLKKSDIEFPTYRQIVNHLLITSLSAIKNIKTSGVTKLGIQAIAPFSTPVAAITDFEISNIKNTTDYFDMYSNVEVSSEFYFKSPVQISFPEPRNLNIVEKESLTAKYLHKIDRTYYFDSPLYLESDAEDLAENLRAIFGDRRAFTSFLIDTRYIETEINDTITLKREKLNGYTLDNGTLKSRNYKVNKLQKNTDFIVLQIEDQKGIEDADDNGEWNTL